MNESDTPETNDQKERLQRDGVFYLVLADLIGSDNFARRKGNAAGIERVKAFSNKAHEALENCKSRTSGIFIKPVGDAVFLVFRHFPDIVEWHLNFCGHLIVSPFLNEPIETRTCVHVGEVRFADGDASGTAVNGLFKFETQTKKLSHVHAQILITEITQVIAGPTAYPPQISIEKDPVMLESGEKIFRVSVPAGIAFLHDKQKRDREIKDAI